MSDKPIPETHDVWDPATGAFREVHSKPREEMEKLVARASLREILNENDRLRKQVDSLQENNNKVVLELRIHKTALDNMANDFHATGSPRSTSSIVLKQGYIDDAEVAWGKKK